MNIIKASGKFIDKIIEKSERLWHILIHENIEPDKHCPQCIKNFSIIVGVKIRTKVKDSNNGHFRCFVICWTAQYQNKSLNSNFLSLIVKILWIVQNTIYIIMIAY